MGFPIRKSMDQSLFAAPHGLSQRTTSFIASQRQGIHRIPLRHLIALIIDARRSAAARVSRQDRCGAGSNRTHHQTNRKTRGPSTFIPRRLGTGPRGNPRTTMPQRSQDRFAFPRSRSGCHPGAKRPFASNISEDAAVKPRPHPRSQAPDPHRLTAARVRRTRERFTPARTGVRQGFRPAKPRYLRSDTFPLHDDQQPRKARRRTAEPPHSKLAIPSMETARRRTRTVTALSD